MDYLNEQLGKCKNDRHVYKLLFKIRTQYIVKEADIVSKNEKFHLHKSKHIFFRHQETFVANNGLNRLTALLSERVQLETSQENNRILEVLLSILGNCTFYKSSSSKVGITIIK
jgi:hypothetical protein